MYAISLTSIPPRFHRLEPVLAALLAQRPAPAQVFLTLPHSYTRFPGPVTPPPLPEGVNLLWHDTDLGPATKALPAARTLAGTHTRLIYCDDDWIYPPHWAEALLAGDAATAVTGQAWDIARLGRRGTGCDIAQGFAGVSIKPDWLADQDAAPPDTAQAVDDIWLSALLARQGISMTEVSTARKGMIPAYDDPHALQAGPRDAQNRACAALVHANYAIWPLIQGR